MVKPRKNLGLLPNVIQAIADLREGSGTAVRHIVDRVRSTMDGKSSAPKNVATEVRKALRQGVDTGLLFYHSGKYQMAMNMSGDIGLPDGGYLARQHRRRRRRRRRRRGSRSPHRRRRRRRRRRGRRSGSRGRSRSGGRYMHRKGSVNGSSGSLSAISNTSNVSGNSNDSKKMTSGNEDAAEVDTSGPMAIKAVMNIKKRGTGAKKLKLKKDRDGKAKDKDDDLGHELLPKKSLVRVKSRASQSRSRRSRSRKLEEINEQLKNDKMPSRRPSNVTFDERKRQNDNMEPRDSYLN